MQASQGELLPIIATGHLTTVGASSNESVREIYVGALEAFPTNAFPPACYIALGHIHKPQLVGGLDHIRYSGSPIALGFDEARQTKQVLLVDLNADGLQAVTALPVPVFQPMASITGSLAQMPALLNLPRPRHKPIAGLAGGDGTGRRLSVRPHGARAGHGRVTARGDSAHQAPARPGCGTAVRRGPRVAG
jgi:hypothetical protein